MISNRIEKSLKTNFIKVRDSGQDQNVAFISISFLRSSIYTESYDFCIGFFLADYYKSEFKEKTYFSLPEFFDQEFDLDIIKFKLSGKIMAIRDYKYEYCKKQISYYRFGIIPFYLLDIVKHIDFTEFKHILSENTSFVYGGYMDKSVELGVYNINGGWLVE